MSDKIGKKYGRLTILSFLKKEKNSKVLCRCECGTEKEFSLPNVTSGRSSSCGCYLREMLSVTKAKRPYEGSYNGLIDKSKRSGWECTISYEDFLDFTKVSFCHYCEGEIFWQEHYRKGVSIRRGYNLDRKDSFLGYSVENCVVSCPRCNRSKSNTFGYEEWVEIGKTIRIFREKHSKDWRNNES